MNSLVRDPIRDDFLLWYLVRVPPFCLELMQCYCVLRVVLRRFLLKGAFGMESADVQRHWSSSPMRRISCRGGGSRSVVCQFYLSSIWAHWILMIQYLTRVPLHRGWHSMKRRGQLNFCWHYHRAYNSAAFPESGPWYMAPFLWNGVFPYGYRV